MKTLCMHAVTDIFTHTLSLNISPNYQFSIRFFFNNLRTLKNIILLTLTNNSHFSRHLKHHLAILWFGSCGTSPLSFSESACSPSGPSLLCHCLHQPSGELFPGCSPCLPGPGSRRLFLATSSFSAASSSFPFDPSSCGGSLQLGSCQHSDDTILLLLFFRLVNVGSCL